MEECRKLLKVSFSVYLSLSLARARALSLSVSVSLFLSCKTLAKVSFYLARTFERGERKREKERKREERMCLVCLSLCVCPPILASLVSYQTVVTQGGWRWDFLSPAISMPYVCPTGHLWGFSGLSLYASIHNNYRHVCDRECERVFGLDK